MGSWKYVVKIEQQRDRKGRCKDLGGLSFITMGEAGQDGFASLSSVFHVSVIVSCTDLYQDGRCSLDRTLTTCSATTSHRSQTRVLSQLRRRSTQPQTPAAANTRKNPQSRRPEEPNKLRTTGIRWPHPLSTTDPSPTPMISRLRLCQSPSVVHPQTAASPPSPPTTPPRTSTTSPAYTQQQVHYPRRQD